MCGRTCLSLGRSNIQHACAYQIDGSIKYNKPEWCEEYNFGKHYCPSYNIAPTEITPVLTAASNFGTGDNNERILKPMMWGMVPKWHKNSFKNHGLSTNNCRIENILSSKLYSSPLLKGNRCIILAEGFYEWQTTNSSKQPYFIFPPQVEGAKLGIPADELNYDYLMKQLSMIRLCDRRVVADLLMLHGIVNDAYDSPELVQLIQYHIPTCNTRQAVTFHCDNVRLNYQAHSPIRRLHSEGNELGYVFDIFNDTKLKVKKLLGEHFARGLQDICEMIEDLSTFDNVFDDSNGWKGVKLLKMAGLYDEWRNEEGVLYSYTVITMPSNSQLDWLHHRMPAILETEQEIANWLDVGRVSHLEAVASLKPALKLCWYPVSTLVNNSREKSPNCKIPTVCDNRIKTQGKKSSAAGSRSLMENWLKGNKQTESQNDLK